MSKRGALLSDLSMRSLFFSTLSNLCFRDDNSGSVRMVSCSYSPTKNSPWPRDLQFCARTSPSPFMLLNCLVRTRWPDAIMDKSKTKKSPSNFAQCDNQRGAPSSGTSRIGLYCEFVQGKTSWLQRSAHSEVRCKELSRLGGRLRDDRLRSKRCTSIFWSRVVQNAKARKRRALGSPVPSCLDSVGAEAK